MKTILKHILTESDNQTFDMVRILAAVTVVAFVVFAGVAVWRTGQFNPQDFGLGAGGLFGGLGAALGLKKESNGA